MAVPLYLSMSRKRSLHPSNLSFLSRNFCNKSNYHILDRYARKAQNSIFSPLSRFSEAGIAKSFTHMKRFASLKSTTPPLKTSMRTVFLASTLSALAMYFVCKLEMAFDHRLSDASIIKIGSKADRKGVYGGNYEFSKACIEIESKIGKENISKASSSVEGSVHVENQTSGNFKFAKAIVYPQTTEEVSFIAKTCHKYRIPLIPVSGATSIEMNLSAEHGGIYINFGKMNKILSINAFDLDAVVQPGVTWEELGEEASKYNLLFGPDPGPGAQIGGMVGTGCSGTNAARYGTMRENTISLTAVLADGTIIKTRKRPRKSSAGYDLTRLIVGSEGTLAIVTEIVVKLHPAPEFVSVASCTFDTVRDAAKTAQEIMLSDIKFGAIELMDANGMELINETKVTSKVWKKKPHLLLKIDGTKSQIEESKLRIQKIANDNNQVGFETAASDEEGLEIWSARKNFYYSFIAARKPGQGIYTTDIAVPLSNLPDIIHIADTKLQELGLRYAIIAHAGDGNIHTNCLYNKEDPEETKRVKQFAQDLAKVAITLEGTVTGEHSVGMTKREALLYELGPDTLGLLRKIKLSLDPLNILNPGHIILDKLPENYL